MESYVKVCNNCGNELPISSFHKHKGGKYGVAAKCKDCRAEHRKTYYDNNKESAKEYSRNYYRENPEKIQQYRLTNSEKIKEYGKEYIRRYYQENKTQINEKAAKYYQENQDKIKDSVAIWCASNPEKVKEYRRQHKALRKSQIGYVPDDYWEQLIDAYGEGCMMPDCDKEIIPGHGKGCNPLTLEHVIPLSKGGLHCMSNFQIMCRSCNCRKNDKVKDFRPFKVWRAI